MVRRKSVYRVRMDDPLTPDDRLRLRNDLVRHFGEEMADAFLEAFDRPPIGDDLDEAEPVGPTYRPKCPEQ